MQRYHEVDGRLRHLSGWKRSVPDPRDVKLKVPFRARFTLPSVGDLSKSPFMPPVEDQGQIGSCAANSSTSVLEFASKRNAINVQLSRLWAYAAVRMYEGTPLTEDSGAEIRDMIKVLATLGCPEESLYPYDEDNYTVEPPGKLELEAKKHRAAFYYKCDTLLQVKACISQGFPLAGGFSVPSNMMSDECERTGVVKYPARGESWVGGHAVMFVGYDDTKKLLKFQNSWSAEWGDRGFGYLPYRFVTEFLADDFWSIRRAAQGAE